MPEVGIQGLGAGDTQHHRAQNDEGHQRVVDDEGKRVLRVDRQQDLGVVCDMHHAKQRDHRKPHQRDRPEEFADAACAAFLHREQHEQDDQRERNHIGLERRRHHFQALDRRQHRDRRGDDTVAVEQGRAENTDRQQHAAQSRAAFDRLRRQCQHGDQSAFTVVVGAQHQHHVLERDDGGQCPEEDRQDAVDILGRERHVSGIEHLLHRIQHAGADVAVDDADRADGQRGERGFGSGQERVTAGRNRRNCCKSRPHCAPADSIYRQTSSPRLADSIHYVAAQQLPCRSATTAREASDCLSRSQS